MFSIFLCKAKNKNNFFVFCIFIEMYEINVSVGFFKKQNMVLLSICVAVDSCKNSFSGVICSALEKLPWQLHIVLIQ